VAPHRGSHHRRDRGADEDAGESDLELSLGWPGTYAMSCLLQATLLHDLEKALPAVLPNPPGDQST
jgi:hypothetical protein